MQDSISASTPSNSPSFARHLIQTAAHHAKSHVGVGIVCSVAYFDPGNWGVDLQAGSQFGYHLLFVILLAGILAAFLQVLAARLTQDRVSFRPLPGAESITTVRMKETDESLVSYLRRLFKQFKSNVLGAFRTSSASLNSATSYSEWQNNSLEFVRAHIHEMIDVAGCLLGFAVIINSLILMLASDVFYYGSGSAGNESPASLFDAYDLVQDNVGKPAAIIFAIALLASVHSSSLIDTVAGQTVSEGFLNWRVSAAVRRMATRLLAIIPSMVIAIALGKLGINALLVVSQVVLSIVLPFVTLPLLYCTSSKALMSVRKGRIDTSATLTPIEDPFKALTCGDQDPCSTAGRADIDEDEMPDYNDNKLRFRIIIWARLRSTDQQLA